MYPEKPFTQTHRSFNVRMAHKEKPGKVSMKIFFSFYELCTKASIPLRPAAHAISSPHRSIATGFSKAN